MDAATRKAIFDLEDEWTAADRAIRAAVKGWAQIPARTGVARGFYGQCGKLAERAGLDAELGIDLDEQGWQALGEAAYKAARLGC
jgi:hypothetical protein